jgi:hypothetical protein
MFEPQSWRALSRRKFAIHELDAACGNDPVMKK